MLRSLCVFCGSSMGRYSAYRNAAHAVGALLAHRNIALVYGGATVGLMGVLADSCLAAGGRVVGVMPRSLVEKEIAHPGLSELHTVASMHKRKARMADLSDAFLALPGGYGTWDEFCEALTWSQLAIQSKACAVLNVEGYYDAFLAQADRAVDDGFLRPEHRELLLADADPARLLDRLQAYEVPVLEKWVDRPAR